MYSTHTFNTTLMEFIYDQIGASKLVSQML